MTFSSQHTPRLQQCQPPFWTQFPHTFTRMTEVELITVEFSDISKFLKTSHLKIPITWKAEIQLSKTLPVSIS